MEVYTETYIIFWVLACYDDIYSKLYQIILIPTVFRDVHRLSQFRRCKRMFLPSFKHTFLQFTYITSFCPHPPVGLEVILSFPLQKKKKTLKLYFNICLTRVLTFIFILYYRRSTSSTTTSASCTTTVSPRTRTSSIWGWRSTRCTPSIKGRWRRSASWTSWTCRRTPSGRCRAGCPNLWPTWT